MSKRNFSGLAQIFGLLGCMFFIAFSFSWLYPWDRHLAWDMRVIFMFLCLFLDALALRSLFEGDDSKLGRFFFRIGDFAMGLLRMIMEPLMANKFKDKFKDLPSDAGPEEKSEPQKRDLNQL